MRLFVGLFNAKESVCCEFLFFDVSHRNPMFENGCVY